MSAKQVANLNGRTVRHNGSVYRIIVATLGQAVLVDAEATYGPAKGEIVNLQKSRSTTARDIRTSIGLGLIS